MVMVVVMFVVVLMFVTHFYWFLIGMNSAQKQIHAEISE